jgi:TIR domain
MRAMPARVIKIFYCYAHEDRALRDELEKHLSPLKRLGRITEWYDRDIQAGAAWEREIAAQLDSADIVLLLVSSDFMYSDYCYSREMQRALERHKRREAYVIPILLRPVDWDETPISQLQMVPADRRPVTQWPDRDEAFLDGAKGIRKTVAFLSAIPVQPFHLWDVMAAALPDEREQRLAYLLYYCGLKPREIARLLPEEFKNIQEVYQLNRSILQGRRTKDELRWFLNSDGQGDQLKEGFIARDTAHMCQASCG